MADRESSSCSIPPPKPSRPFTEYNVFSQLEREHILQANGQGCAAQHPASVDPNAASRPERYRHLILSADWYVVGKCRNKKRKHRKTHGTITFVELTKTISKAWGKVDATTKKYCKEMADKELKRYRKDTAEYITKYGAETTKIKWNTQTEQTEQEKDDAGEQLAAQMKQLEVVRMMMEREMQHEIQMQQFEFRRVVTMQLMNGTIEAKSPAPPSSSYPSGMHTPADDDVSRIMQRAAAMERVKNRMERKIMSYGNDDISPHHRLTKYPRIASSQEGLADFTYEQELQQEKAPSHICTSPQQSLLDVGPSDTTKSCDRPSKVQEERMTESFDGHMELFMSSIEAAKAAESKNTDDFFDDIQAIDGENVMDVFEDDVDCDNLWSDLADASKGSTSAPESAFKPLGKEVYRRDISHEYLERIHRSCKK